MFLKSLLWPAAGEACATNMTVRILQWYCWILSTFGWNLIPDHLTPVGVWSVPAGESRLVPLFWSADGAPVTSELITDTKKKKKRSVIQLINDTADLKKNWAKKKKEEVEEEGEDRHFLVKIMPSSDSSTSEFDVGEFSTGVQTPDCLQCFTDGSPA